MRRIRILAVGFAMVVAACGTVNPVGGPGDGTTSTSSEPQDTTTTTSERTTTTSPSPATTTTEPATTTTTGSQVTATTSAPTTSVPTGTVEVAPYFYVDETGHPNRSGPFLLPVAREVPATKAVARAATEQLLAGPTSGERTGIPAISTFIPEGVRLLGLSLSYDVATVDLSGEFEADDDSAATAQRVAQVVFTLSRYPTISEVLFRQDGKAIKVPTGDGQLVSRPVNLADYLDFAAVLHVEQPAYSGEGADPLHVTGFGAVFEATFNYALTDDDGLIIAEGIAMTTNGTGWGGFDFEIDYHVDRPQVGALIVWAYSAEDGSQIDVREYPVALVP